MPYPNIKFQTDQTGANQNVCSGSSITFNFSLTNISNLVEANIVLKKGSSTVENIVVSVYDQQNGGGSLVASVEIPANDITQSYTPTAFNFNNVILSPDISYSLVLSSASSCSGSSPYSMKSGNFQVLNSDTNILLNTGYGVSASVFGIGTFLADATVMLPSPTPTATPTMTPATTPTPTPTISATPNITQTLRVGIKNVKFKLGIKSPKIYQGNLLVYDPIN